MKLVCSVYDRKAELWGLPFYSHSRPTAVRDFAAAVKGGSGNVAQFPEDYELYLLGAFDDTTGVISIYDRQLLASGTDFSKEV